MSFHAFVDESEPSVHGDSGVYLLAGAVIVDDHLDTARAVIGALRLRGQRKLHWRDEKDHRRMLGIKTIATLPAIHLVVVRAAASEHSERRQRLCLHRLRSELDLAGVTEVVLERRQRRQDHADSQLRSALRAAQTVSGGLRLRHAAGTEEPLLWLPDFVAGAAGAARRGTYRYLDQRQAWSTCSKPETPPVDMTRARDPVVRRGLSTGLNFLTVPRNGGTIESSAYQRLVTHV